MVITTYIHFLDISHNTLFAAHFPLTKLLIIEQLSVAAELAWFEVIFSKNTWPLTKESFLYVGIVSDID